MWWYGCSRLYLTWITFTIALFSRLPMGIFVMWTFINNNAWTSHGGQNPEFIGSSTIRLTACYANTNESIKSQHNWHFARGLSSQVIGKQYKKHFCVMVSSCKYGDFHQYCVGNMFLISQVYLEFTTTFSVYLPQPHYFTGIKKHSIHCCK